MKNQYKEALAKARAENKLVFINFTGYACTNCHWMKANMFPRPEINGLSEGFRAGGSLYRRHRRRVRAKPAARRKALRHGGDSVLRHRRSGRAHHRDLPGSDAQRLGIRDVSEDAATPRLRRASSGAVIYSGSIRQIQLRRQGFLFPRSARRLPLLERLVLQAFQQLGLPPRFDQPLALLLRSRPSLLAGRVSISPNSCRVRASGKYPGLCSSLAAHGRLLRAPPARSRVRSLAISRFSSPSALSCPHSCSSFSSSSAACSARQRRTRSSGNREPLHFTRRPLGQFAQCRPWSSRMALLPGCPASENRAAAAAAGWRRPAWDWRRWRRRPD